MGDSILGLGVVVTSTEEIGDLMREARKASGITQLDIAGLSGSGNRFIVDAEKGKPTIQAQKLIKVLGLLGLEVVIRRKSKV